MTDIITDDSATRHCLGIGTDMRWTATRGDYDLDCRVGYGATEEEAIADLIEQEDDFLESLREKAMSGDRLAQIALKNMGETL